MTDDHSAQHLTVPRRCQEATFLPLDGTVAPLPIDPQVIYLETFNGWATPTNVRKSGESSASLEMDMAVTFVVLDRRVC